MKSIIGHLERAFTLTFDLAQNMTDDSLAMKLGGLPSNTIGEQFWCMIGARESYLNAMKNGKWSGFSCSLKTTVVKDALIQCLRTSHEERLKFLHRQDLSGTQLDFLLTLLEHEIQHHGQLIRYVYGNRLGFPKSWKERYTV